MNNLIKKIMLVCIWILGLIIFAYFGYKLEQRCVDYVEYDYYCNHCTSVNGVLVCYDDICHNKTCKKYK